MGDVGPLWAVASVQWRVLDSWSETVKPLAVKQGEIQRRDGIVVRMPHHATVHPMGDVVPHTVALDADSYCVATRRLVYGDTWHEGADASRGHRWDERHDSTSFIVAAAPATSHPTARQIAVARPVGPG